MRESKEERAERSRICITETTCVYTAVALVALDWLILKL